MSLLRPNAPISPDESRNNDSGNRFNSNKHIVRPSELQLYLGISKTTCWRLSKDPTSGFPRKIRMSNGSVGYFRHELDAWLESRRER